MGKRFTRVATRALGGGLPSNAADGHRAKSEGGARASELHGSHVLTVLRLVCACDTDSFRALLVSYR